MWKILILTTANYISVTFVTHPYNIQSYLLLRVIVACTTFCLAEPRLDKNPWKEGPVDFIIASGYDPVPVDDKLLPSHKDEKVKREEFSTRHSFNFIQSFDYSSIFSYDDHKEQKQFKSVFKFEDLPRTNYEADYFKVMNQKLFLNLNF